MIINMYNQVLIHIHLIHLSHCYIFIVVCIIFNINLFKYIKNLINNNIFLIINLNILLHLIYIIYYLHLIELIFIYLIINILLEINILNIIIITNTSL